MRKRRIRAEGTRSHATAARLEDPTQKIEFIAKPSKNPARGSGWAQLLSFNLTNALICAIASTGTCRAQSLYCANQSPRTRTFGGLGFAERRNKAIAPYDSDLRNRVEVAPSAEVLHAIQLHVTGTHVGRNRFIAPISHPAPVPSGHSASLSGAIKRLRPTILIRWQINAVRRSRRTIHPRSAP
jgi:hypothetical protein